MLERDAISNPKLVEIISNFKIHSINILAAGNEIYPKKYVFFYNIYARNDVKNRNFYSKGSKCS